MMPRELFGSDRLARAVPYHYASAATGRTLVFTAGACPLDEEGRVVAAGNVADQTCRCIENLWLALEAAGCSPSSIVKTTIFVASSARAALLEAWGEYENVFGTDGPPSTLLGVASLGWPEQLVEIEAVAVQD
jgi:enamine deaminase RidA (YjgF/YER057c/UK114 family)